MYISKAFHPYCILQNSSTRLKWGGDEYATKDSFHQLRMAQVQSHELEEKLYKNCSSRAPILLHPSLYMVHKSTFLTENGGIIDGRITSDEGSVSHNPPGS